MPYTNLVLGGKQSAIATMKPTLILDQLQLTEFGLPALKFFWQVSLFGFLRLGIK